MDGRLLFDVSNQVGCEKFNREAREDPLVGESPFIMVQEGNCSIFEKIRHIEQAGGHLAIIISDKFDLVKGIFISEEGSGSDINIPAILINKNDGRVLASYYINHVQSHEEIKDIRIEVQFENENLDNTVKYDLWYTPDQENAYLFMKDFRDLKNALGDNAILGVHFLTYPHFSYKEYAKQEVRDCLGSGLYCIRPGKAGVVNGANVVREILRQKCVHYYAFDNKNKKKRDLFWNYMDNFYEMCFKEKKIDDNCSDKVMQKVGIPIKEIYKCYNNSFYEYKDESFFDLYSKNYYLDRDYELRKENVVTKSPSITINDRLYLGKWEPEYVFESLCASLIDKPEACYLEVTFERNLNGVTLGQFIITIVIVLIINVSIFLVCKRIIKKGIADNVDSSDIDNKIDNVVGSYLALRDSAPNDE